MKDVLDTLNTVRDPTMKFSYSNFQEIKFFSRLNIAGKFVLFIDHFLVRAVKAKKSHLGFL